MDNWEVQLQKIQDEIEPLAKSHYKIYRAEEIYYWYHCAKWMNNDSEKNKNIDKVLDVGCGHGTLSVFAKRIYDCEVISLDVMRYLNHDMVRNFDLNYILLDIETEIREIFKKEEFDRIIMTETLEHLYFNPVPTLYNLREMLKPNGKLFLSTPDMVEWGFIDGFYKHVGEMPNPDEIKKPDFSSIDQHIYQYNQGEVNRILSESGFKIEKFSHCKIGSRARHLNYMLSK